MGAERHPNFKWSALQGWDLQMCRGASEKLGVGSFVTDGLQSGIDESLFSGKMPGEIAPRGRPAWLREIAWRQLTKDFVRYLLEQTALDCPSNFPPPSLGGLPFPESHSTVVAIRGHKTSLPCDLSSPIPDDPVQLILWYREDTGSPIYTQGDQAFPLGVWDPPRGTDDPVAPMPAELDEEQTHLWRAHQEWQLALSPARGPALRDWHQS
ncbi:unnamed protein product [Notodromas monacha]|uniref:Ig-like domain-containing protein n=1 Tax=Notodromas monacha TaxID=399045 RepID=A0A7R9BDF6_9CRUS|nr:unnamed protein product [Notodromas monacha]CAG0912464.1 unnamed protein product [Notodromas monacha]